MAAGVSISSLRVVGFTCLSLLLVETAGLKGVPYHVTDITSFDSQYYVAGVESHHEDMSLSRQRRQVLSSSNGSSTSDPSSALESTTLPPSPSTLAPTTKLSTTTLPGTTTTSTAPTTTATTTRASTSTPTPSLPPTSTSKSTSTVSSTTPSEGPTGAGPKSTSTVSTETTESVDIVEETDHKYYTTKVLQGEEANRMWTDLSTEKGVTKHATLSESHRTAATTQISFMFPFYGHEVKQVTIATGGFIYMSSFLHQWLTATQYIAPLMANFDTEIGDSSHIYYADNGTTFAVQWDSVYLQDHQKGAFSFQAILHKSGRIIFVYKTVPVKLATVPTKNHPVKVGVSDAYYEDRDVSSEVRRRTIYEYNRVSINFDQITNNTAVIISPNPTCTAIKDCAKCITANINFDCQWCPDAGRCSDGLDRKRQDWLQRRCHETYAKSANECPSGSTSKPNIAVTSEPHTTQRSSRPATSLFPLRRSASPKNNFMPTLRPANPPTTTSYSVPTTSIPVVNKKPQTTVNPRRRPTTSVIRTRQRNVPTPTPTQSSTFTTTTTPITTKTTVTTTATTTPETTPQTFSTATTPRRRIMTTRKKIPSVKFTGKQWAKTQSFTASPSPVINQDTQTPPADPNMPQRNPDCDVVSDKAKDPSSEFKAVDECYKYPFRPQNGIPDAASSGKQGSQTQDAKNGNKLGIGPIIIIILSIALVVLIVGWFVYAYMNPTSRSGMWLIEHRPSMLKAKLNKVRFWKRGGDTGEKYEVSMQPEGESVA